MMTDYMGKISEKAFENFARASLAQDETIDTLSAELATVTAERDAWRNDAEAKADALAASRAECNQWARKVATVEAERDSLRAAVDTYAADLVRVTGERDALRAEVERINNYVDKQDRDIATLQNALRRKNAALEAQDKIVINAMTKNVEPNVRVTRERDELGALVKEQSEAITALRVERDALRVAWMATPKQSIRVVCDYALTTDIPRWCVRAVDEWMDAMHKP
jgi:chromosome segregation ATPase